MFDIGYPATAWYINYLQAFVEIDNTNDHTLDGVAGDPVSDGIDLIIQGGDGADNQVSPSGIYPAYQTATVIWTYDPETDAALRIDMETYRAIYLAFGYEAINNVDDRRAVMMRSMNWLTRSPTTIQPSAPQSLKLLSCAPNPARGVTAFRFSLPSDGDIRLNVYRADGRLVRTIVDGPAAAGEHVISWDLTDWRGGRVPAGVYFYRLHGPQLQLTRKLLVVR
jgi:hypothetical protein